ncbi:MAG: hypothetical protein A3J83_00760 [Elusimicrobia bacterium RIFOXYA2_FULL_40_6]|nr:MAG: hypothetical protein A3J83_00760 [Elusimicrobia bacterium RIFOXYA2_FULL_40_6]
MTTIKPTILAVDDESSILESFKVLLEQDYNLLTADSGEGALDIIRKKDVDLVLLDILMPGMDGMEILRKIKEINESIDVIMITAVKTVKTAIEAMKLGAYDYISKPFDADEMLNTISKVIEKRSLLKEVTYYRSEAGKDVVFENIVSISKEMEKVFEVVKEMVKNDATVLICGESGTGKELIARAIHYNSLRKEKPFVTVDCASMPENLMESELFGYEKGAFTDALSQKLGKFELANSGTIFLDEIGNLKMDTQSKLLRVLQERELQRLGGLKAIKIDVRIISATNIDLVKAIREGRFREDLYYRLNVVPINIPPLRERKEDVSLLAEHFVDKYNKVFNKKIKGLSQKALEYLMNYKWPGNVRELKNVIERLVVLAKSETIAPVNLPTEILLSGKTIENSAADNSKVFKNVRNQFEIQYLLTILDKVRWNQTKAAKLLGIHRNTLIWKMRTLNIKSLRKKE